MLSDKTGTLTKNDMIFKKINLEYYSFTDDDRDDIRVLLSKGLRKTKDKLQSLRMHGGDGAIDSSDVTSDEGGSLLDPEGFLVHPKEKPDNDLSDSNQSSQDFEVQDQVSNQRTNASKLSKPKRRAPRRREQHLVVMDLFLALILCHNVTPVYTPDEGEDEESPAKVNSSLASPDKKGSRLEESPSKLQANENSEKASKKVKKDKKEFQASSPDEIALVQFAESLDMILLERDDAFIRIQDANGHEQQFEILENFPFSSETKRMGIIVRSPETGTIMFYLKGAEVVMEKKVRPEQRISLTESCEQLAQDGLRTLVISQKELSEAEFAEFSHKYKEARASLGDREAKVQQVIEQIEDGMEFLAVTGVEDRLQDQVLETIEKFRDAGIQVWMLTGDKIETAKCIAIATGMNHKSEKVHEIRGDQGNWTTFELEESVRAYNKCNRQKTMLMIDGSALARISAEE